MSGPVVVPCTTSSAREIQPSGCLCAQVAHEASALCDHQHLAYGNVSCLRITSHNNKPLPGSYCLNTLGQWNGQGQLWGQWEQKTPLHGTVPLNSLCCRSFPSYCLMYGLLPTHSPHGPEPHTAKPHLSPGHGF